MHLMLSSVISKKDYLPIPVEQRQTITPAAMQTKKLSAVGHKPANRRAPSITNHCESQLIIELPSTIESLLTNLTNMCPN